MLFLLAATVAANAQPLDSLAALTTSGNVTVSGEVLEKYPSLDLMNSFTGVVPGLWQTENYGRTGVRFNAQNCAMTIRGYSSPVYVVDGVVITELTELQINPEEIESVTVVSDILDKMRIGPEAAMGAICIKTLPGTKTGQQVKFSFEKGVDAVDRWPGWVNNSTDYATLNNLARENSNYAIRYQDFAMAEFAKNDPYSAAFPSVDYKEMMFRNTREYNKAHMMYRGGSENLQYSANVGWVSQGDIYAAGAKSDYNRINAKMNLGIRINRSLDVNFSFIGVYGIRRTPLSSYSGRSEVCEFPKFLNYSKNTPSAEYPISLGTDDETGRTVYPVTTAYPNHPWASLLECGSYKETTRTGITKATVNYDLGSILKGLKSETQIAYNILYLLRTGQASDYLAYNYDSDIWSASTTHSGVHDTKESEYKTLYLQSLQFYEKLKYDLVKNDHYLNAELVYFRSNMAYNVNSSYHNQQNFTLNADYCYDRKYLIQATALLAGSSSLKPGNRYRVFPALGLGWIMDEEPWVRNSSWLNSLKLRAQAGITGNELYGEQFYWQSKYSKSAEMVFGPYSLNQWFGSNTYSTRATTMDRVANFGLDWEKLYEVSIGADAVLFDGLKVGTTWYYSLRSGIVTDVSAVLPASFGVTTMYDNYNAYSYSGLELNMEYGNRVGDFRYNVKTNLILPNSKFKKYCENITDENLIHSGKSTGMILGYDYLGTFASEQDIQNSPNQVFDAETHIGDFKYRDVNNDGTVDSNDRLVIGDSSPRLMYSLCLNLGYKIFDLTIVGTGKAFFDTILSSSYYWNGWGDGNYSLYVKNNLNNPSAYPGLSYIKSENNFRYSQYWMRDGSFFKIQNIELGCNFKPFRLFVRGANLLTISGIKDSDPESMSSGVTDYPLFRTVTGGIKFIF